MSFEFFPEFLSLKRRLWHWFLRPKKLFQEAKEIITVSKNTSQDLIGKYNIPGSKISVVYPGISPNYKVLTENDIKLKTIKNKYKLPDKFILFLGTIEPRKNIQSLVSAFNIFNKNNPGYSLVIAGKKGWKTAAIEKKLKQTQDNSKQDEIICTQFVPDSDKRYLYNLASMFVYPSYYEGFGFPPLEAMASGCPVITSNNSSMSEICADAALLIDPTNVNDLARAMEQMIDPQLADYYKTKGLEKAKQFIWYQSAREVLNVLESIASK